MKNSQTYKLDLEKAKRSPRSNCQHALEFQKARELLSKSKGIPKSKRNKEKYLLLLH